MAAVVIVGDGPGGLSAALFLAKNGHQVTVFGEDKTSMHYAISSTTSGYPRWPVRSFNLWPEHRCRPRGRSCAMGT